MLRANALWKSYGTRITVAGAALTVEPGEIVGLLGPDEAGKTTVAMICGLIAPDRGEVTIDGEAMAGDADAVKRRVDPQSQNAIFATLVMVMLGAAWAPTFIFPDWLQTLLRGVPTRWAVDGLDAMTWRGLGLQAALAPIGVMLVFSAAFTLIAIARFDREE